MQGAQEFSHGLREAVFFWDINSTRLSNVGAGSQETQIGAASAVGASPPGNCKGRSGVIFIHLDGTRWR